MNALDHIKGLLANLEQGFDTLYETALDEFAEDHHVDMVQWFGSEWTDLFLAETTEQRITALKALRKRYEELKETENDVDT